MLMLHHRGVRWRVAHSHRDPAFALSPLLTLLMLALVACTTVGEHCYCPTANDIKLALPHVTQVRALDSLLASVSAAGAVQGIAAYTGGAAPAGHTTALLDIHSTLYTFDLTDQSLQPVTTSGLVCQGPALSSDERFVACTSGPSQGATNCAIPCTGTTLELATLSANWPPVAHVVQQVAVPGQQARDTFVSPSWSPDGRHLVVVEPLNTSDLTLFARGDGASPLAVSAHVRLSGVAYNTVKQVVWSPDGKYLALIYNQIDVAVEVGVVSVSDIPAVAFSSTADPTTVTVAPHALTANPSPIALLRWTPDSTALTMLDGSVPPQAHSQELLEQVAVPSGAVSTPFLRFPVDGAAGVGAFAWMNDGRTLLFSYGTGEYGRSSVYVPNTLDAVRAPATCACVFPPPVMYTYTAS